MVAPLHYGAGIKGKITQSLAAGLPVVTTPIGAEGLDGGEDRCMLIGHSPQELAVETIRLYKDDELWLNLSRAGQALIVAQCSTRVLSERLRLLLDGSSASQVEPTHPIS